MLVALKELGEIITGNTPSKKNIEYYDSDDICFVKPDIISDSEISIINSSNEYISEKARTKARIVQENTIFVTCIGTIGKIGIAEKGDYAFNQQINAIVPNDRTIPKYLAYALFYSKAKLSAIANAPVVPIINKTQFGDFRLNIESDITKQKQIITTLDKLQSIITHRKQQLTKLDELVKARFVEMFGDIEDKRTIAEICSIITDGTHQPPKFVENGIPFLFVSNIVTNEITYNAEKFISEETYNELYKRTPIEIGDIILSTVGSYGHPAIVKSNERFLFQRHIAYLKPISNIINSSYLHSAILSNDVQRQIDERVKGIAQKTLNLSEIRKIVIPIPQLDAQEQFADFVKKIDKSKFLNENVTRLLRRVKLYDQF